MAPLGIGTGFYGVGPAMGSDNTAVIEYDPDALDLTGHRSYVDAGATFQSTFTRSYTLSIWFNLTSYTSPSTSSLAMHTLFGTNDGTGERISLALNGIDSVNKIKFIMEGANDDLVVTNSDEGDDFSDDGWKHIAVTVTQNSGGNTGVIIYVNGAAVDTTDTGALSEANHTNYVNAYNLYIGARNNQNAPEEYFYGLIKDPALWSEALTAANVAKLYNSGVPFDITSDSGDYDNSDTLVALWRFNVAAGGTVAQGFGGNDGIIHSATRIDSGL